MVDLDPKMNILDIIELYPQTEGVFNLYAGGQDFNKNISVESFCIDNSIPFFSFWKELTLKTKDNKTEDDMVQSEESIIPIPLNEEQCEECTKINVNDCWENAKNDLRGCWGRAAWITFILYWYSFGLAMMPGTASKFHYIFECVALFMVLYSSIFIEYRYRTIFLECHRGNIASFSMNVFYLYLAYNRRDFSARILTTMLLRNLYIFLWTLLLIVPGIIKAISYVLTPYILKDYPELSGNKAIELSMAMMEGYKMKWFVLELKYILCLILGLFTLGIANLWVIPYFTAVMANFYEHVRYEYRAKVK